MTDVLLLLDGLAAAPACLVRVESTEGSAPREPGAWMAVFADRIVGTIGGGHLELQAIAEARRRLGGGSGPAQVRSPMRFALGPALGQCCGGVVHLGFERLTAADLAPAAGLRARLTPRQHPVALFGGGHVGHALARVLAPLPFALTWIDSRDGIFPSPAPQGVVCEHSDPVQLAVPRLAPGSRVLIMSFSHAEDLDVVAACLRRQREQADLPFIGLIGSKTKWATFSNRLHGRGFAPDELAQVTCPIGIPGIEGKEPDVIAVAVAAQLLQTLKEADRG
ncbi:xanthine dehydrogenase [Acidovorax sp. Root275]|uniref:xanthine dehydrogenase accessory protein XdhC n=1 Tax=unclassified Acidovorax TaxID=2684926 RepID=UPI00070B4F86|nr:MULTISPECIES: xanthine dehydrogenase accessory protein XdhC [unclassified Acidovorax]KRD15669.1 xanthine dehydrogenase [Acidovorax sp. Root267]KRD41901.1 xanthine dehydrogenase [Acidovorax sp. Root275]